jgi:hypothetical protein
MSAEIAVLNALGLIPAAIENEIVAGIEDGVALFRDHTEVASVGISVHDSGFVAAETGFGGISYGPQSFALYGDPSSAALRVKTRFNAAATTVHELHPVCVNALARCAPTIGCALETFLSLKAWPSIARNFWALAPLQPFSVSASTGSGPLSIGSHLLGAIRKKVGRGATRRMA